MALARTATIEWHEQPTATGVHRLELALDRRCTHALVRYLDIAGAILGATLWDLRSGSVVPGEIVDLHPDGRTALRRDGEAIVLVDLAERAPTVQLATRARLLALCPDAPYVVERPRADIGEDGRVRATLEVLEARSGRALHALETKSVLEALLPGGRLAAVGSRGAVTVWDLATGERVGKSAGLAKPASIRVAPAGTFAIGARDGKCATFAAEGGAPSKSGTSRIVLTGDAQFDGSRLVGTNVLLDVATGRAKSHAKGWLTGRRHASAARERTVLLEHPLAAVLTSRDLLGAPVVELWNVESSEKLSSIEVGEQAATLAFANGTIVVAHAPRSGSAGPALTVLAT